MRAIVIGWLSLCLWGCGGPATPSPKTPEGSGEGQTADENERKEWMKDCVEQPGMEDFCSCSFDHVAARTTAEERKDSENPNSKKALEGLTAACGDKLPKSFLKQEFTHACTKTPGMEAYCGCSFEYLYSHDLLKGDESALVKAEPDMKKACMEELYQLAKQSFVGACMENSPAGVCNCTFSGLEKKFGKEKLVQLFESRSDEIKKATRESSRSCGAD